VEVVACHVDCFEFRHSMNAWLRKDSTAVLKICGYKYRSSVAIMPSAGTLKKLRPWATSVVCHKVAKCIAHPTWN